MRIGVQGIGAVGIELCKLVAQDGASLVVCDMNQDSINTLKETVSDLDVVDLDDIYNEKMDIFAPCAMGGSLNDTTIEMLNVDIIAGAANNQLLEAHHDKMLRSKGILYVPDYVINSGGVICVGYEYFRNSGYNPQDFNIERGSMVAHVEKIGDVVTEILQQAQKRDQATGETADQLAEERFLRGSALNDNDVMDDDEDYESGPASPLVH